MEISFKIHELFEKAKVSPLFAGLSEEAIWQACLDYADRSEAEIDAAIRKMGTEDDKIAEEKEKKAKVFTEGRKKLVAMKRHERIERKKDEGTADALLAGLFK